MGTYIQTVAEIKTPDGWQINTAPVFRSYLAGPAERAFVESPFHWQDYGMFAFFADVCNYSGITPLSKSRGLPEDADEMSVGTLVPGAYFEDGWAEPESPLTVAQAIARRGRIV